MSKFFYPCQDKNVTFNNSILVWPALTLGNIGQLATDLILNTFEFKRVGYIHDEDIVPLVGNDTLTPTGTGILSLAIEVYQTTNKNNSTITVVQQRSPILSGHINSFADKLTQWIEQSNFKQLLFLASTNANKRVDTQLFGTQMRYVISESLNNNSSILDKLEKDTKIPAMERSVIVDGDLIQLSDRLTGLGKRLMSITNQKKDGFSLVAMILFCSEGDNTQDAIEMSNYVVKYLDLVENDNNNNNTVNFKIPSSWNLIRDGSSINQALYF